MALITEKSLRAMLGKGHGLPNPFPLAEGDRVTPAAADFLKDRRIGLRRTPGVPVSRTSLIPVGVSNRHVHLSPEHVEALFGTGYELKPLRELSQKGQFAAQETVTLIGPKGAIPSVRILGPARGSSQAEISQTDGYRLGVSPAVRLSGDIRGTPGIVLAGPAGTISLEEGLIVARNHVHLSPEEAQELSVQPGDRLLLQTLGDRPIIFADAVARISPRFSLDFHIDTDEANAAALRTGDRVRLVGINMRIADLFKGGLR
ncbi:phosphate propanoyltransferase [Cohnella endophytica]|uniref:Phosphate propanoyltransferase n=1 Tax=Cohnella endophytica TaxID=2419778 RepID=A0A494XYG4_9BACL|nr:phosphate propanoyltransferase [Cohnella endophytica]RKP54069.1 phosphate propanoyltransferase [Cohnella endophytica]